MYIATTWINGVSPPLSAANLNKLTDELEAQAAAEGISHSLPTWANGVPPALTDAAPLNEMERVADEVATARGLSYTPTTWQDDWTPARNATNLNKLEAQVAANSDEEDPGTFTDASPGQAASVINAASGGNTVRLVGGVHPLLTLPKSFSGASPLTVRCAPGSYALGVNTNSRIGYVFDTFESHIAAEFSNQNLSPFYVSGASEDITIIRSKLSGGYDCLKQYCAAPGWARRIKLIDSELYGAGGDLIHINGVDDLLIEHNYLHDPATGGAEHHDAFQNQRGKNFQFLRNIVTWPGTPVDFVNQCMMLGGVEMDNGLIANNLFHHWRGGIGIIVITWTGASKLDIVNNTFYDNSNDISINLNGDYGAIPSVHIWNNIIESIYASGGASPAYMNTNWIRTPRSGHPNGSNIIGTGAPGFVNNVAYELTGGSAARSAGIAHTGLVGSTPAADLDGTTRPSPPGLGARI